MKRFKNTADNEDMGVTVVSNAFINHFMPKADCDEVRVYLYGLKYASSFEEEFPSDEKIAEFLDIPKEEVEKAWAYWESEGIIKIEEDGSIEYFNVAYMLFAMPLPLRRNKKTKKNTSRKINDMFAEIEARISRPLSINEHEVILDWIDEYKFTPQTVIMIVEYCLTREGGRNIAYWAAVADNLHADGVNTYEQACDYFAKRTANYRRNKDIMDYLGLHRSPSEPENRLIKKWYDEYGFDIETVKKACDETVKTNKPNLKYIDSILSAWHEGKDAPSTGSTASSSKTGGKKTRLNDEHNYDIDALQKVLFGEGKEE